MNIWIVSDGEPLPTDEGNVRLRRMGLLSEILYRNGNEVHWFSSSFHHYKKKHRSNNDKDIKINNNYTIHLLKTKGYRKNVSIARISHHKKLSRKFLLNTKAYEKPDIIIATMAPLEVSKAVIQYGEYNNVPVIIDIRDLWPEIFNEVVPSWGKTLIKPYIWLCKSQLRTIIRKSTGMIGVTPQFLDYGLNVARMNKREFDQVFYTSYKPRDISGHLNNFNKHWSKFGLKSTDFIVIFLGNFGRQFVLEPIIEAAEKLKEQRNIKFVLCGVGESLDKIKRMSSNLENVILPGWIEEEQILSLLSASSIGIAPYRNSINFTKNTPNKFGEYLSASIPVILGVNGIMEELVSEYECGDNYKDSNELVTILERLFLDRQQLIGMSENAYKLYEEKFNADKVYLELSRYLQEVTSKSN
ncbi:glycosyltransferase family 4 protein [Neobacillus novalis]|uniref:Glycosyltransferase family 4 protein n=1 Tax=Neobacillus novalis TaxID=220687 RepID=A0AA95MRP4_9BACI|nr:glycosyltransferase family 4 protein [Neobacillus novalis]WHY86076.1 glycosyltransferase family 4 protein [Neobacillus novalis]